LECGQEVMSLHVAYQVGNLNNSPIVCSCSFRKNLSNSIKMLQIDDSALTTFSLQTAQDLVTNSNAFPVDFDVAWQWLGYSQKDKAKRALLNCGFTADIDFTINCELGSLAVPRPSEKIYLTTECLKLWGMMAGTEQGKQVRLYFLECEKIAKQATITSIPQTLPEALRAYADEVEAKQLAEAKVKVLTAQIEANKDTSRAVNVLMNSMGGSKVGDFAKHLAIKNLGRNNFFKWLKTEGYLMLDNEPYQKYVNSGYFKTVVKVANGETYNVTIILPKGQTALIKNLTKQGYITE
jgi:anti-repressor protein